MTRDAVETIRAMGAALDKAHAKNRVLADRNAEQEAAIESLDAEVVICGRERDAAERRVKELAEALRRAAFVAEHLHGMIDRETWRDSGAEWMGQYEGDYWAEQVAEEIKSWAALAAVDGEPREGKRSPAGLLVGEHPRAETGQVAVGGEADGETQP